MNAFSEYGRGAGRVGSPLIEQSIIDRIRAAFDISAVADRLGLKTRKRGHEYVGLCPFHNERTASWTLNDAKGFAHCFGCGAHHDTIGLVMVATNVRFREALGWLDSSEMPPVDPVIRQEQERATRAAKLAQIADARRWLAEAADVSQGDPVDVYLKARGIYLPPPLDIRFGMVPAWQDPESKEWGPLRPCMLCAARDATGSVTGAQRVFFYRNDPALGKADKPKRSWGSIRGSPCRLGGSAPHIHMAEGPEDALSALEMMPERPCWAAFGTSQMPFATFPSVVTEVTLLGQNNEPGRVAVRKAALALVADEVRGLIIREAFPPAEFDDWNDMHRGIQK